VKDPKHMETPYVVMFQSVNILSDDEDKVGGYRRIQECWEFEHPKKDLVTSESGLFFSQMEEEK
jgi:type II protein arginine methyltransferase